MRKALTVRQPWAWLICSGLKDVENRSWRTSHRGPLLIHAGLTVERVALNELRRQLRARGTPVPEFPTGVIVGAISVLDCVEQHPSEWFVGPIGWVLSNPVMFDNPIPAKGRPGIWETQIDIIPEVIDAPPER